MRLIRIATASINATVGAVRSNVDRAIAACEAAAREGATLVALPEQAIGGYAPEDLVQWRAFVEAQWGGLLRLAAATEASGVLVAVGVTVAIDARLYNCAALLHRGQIVGLVPKEKLPTYSVFYEARTFACGTPKMRETVRGVPMGDLVFETDFGILALEVCEDVWSPDGPMRRRCYAGAELVVNLSASPFRVGITDTRREMLATRASDNQCTVVYANLVGANDGLIFDGGGLVAQNGRVMLDAPRFREGVWAATIDLDRTRRLRTENTTWRTDRDTFVATSPCAELVKLTSPSPGSAGLTYPVPPNKSFFLPREVATPSPRARFCEDILSALALGIGDYYEKTGAFETIGVALSGGRDSLLCLWIARRYLDQRLAECTPEERDAQARKTLRAFFMPSRYSSEKTRAAAIAAAAELCAPLEIVSIDDAFVREVAESSTMLQPGEALTALARQNIQARLRAARMWTWANSARGLFLQTSNMSEKSVGYTTIGGDMEGALSVIANLPKTVVNYLLDYLLETTHSAAIAMTLDMPASAELAEGMEDEKDLMPFPVLDACFALYAGEKMSLPEVKLVLRAMFAEYGADNTDAWASKFGRLFTSSIYKWVQTPITLHVGNLDLDRERALQLPVVQRNEW
jgi:NAD+ synthase (glutamine-hydrolysing)